MCLRQVADLAKYIDAFEKKNAQLVVIGNGEPHFIRPFRATTRYKGKLLTNPGLEAYKSLDFKRGVGAFIGFKSLKEGIQALGSGYSLKGIQGDPMQQGGAIIIGPGDIVHYFYVNKEAGDHPPIDEMLKACGDFDSAQSDDTHKGHNL